jgi:hypothetical protein
MARNHDLVVKAGDSQLSGCGLESWQFILDGCKQCLLLQLKNNKNKGSQMGHTKKIYKMYLHFILHASSQVHSIGA